MQPQLEIQVVNIVIRGDFNPAMFHPSWLAAQGLIRSQEADAAEIKIIHPQIAQFNAEWLQMNITPDRFQAATAQEPYYEPLRDLVIGVFSLLTHTPMRLIGINRDFHYRLESENAWHGVGDRLAPKEDWHEVLSSPGMASLTIQGRRSDDLKGYIRVKVEPSAPVHPGVYVNVNDHYELPSASQTPSSADEAMKIFSEQWAQSMQRGLQIARKIVSLGGPDECGR